MKAAIPKPDFKSQIFFKDGNTDNIIEVIINVIKKYNIAAETKEFSKNYRATYEDMKRLYWFVKDNIEYTEDPTGFQWIRTPARAWSDRRAGIDCKSFTVFLVSVFQNLGLPYIVRFTSYSNSQRPTHVYPLVKIGGRWVIMDAVWDMFDDEKPFTFKKDFKMSEIAVLSGVGTHRNNYNRVGATNRNNYNRIGMVLLREAQETADIQTQQLIQEISAVTDNIPDSIVSVDGGDITQMTGGEFSRWLAAKQYPQYATSIKQGLITSSTPPELEKFILQTADNNAPAFQIPFDVAELNGIGSIFSKVGDWFKSQWQKLMNFVFKDGLKKSAEFFMYLFTGPISSVIKLKKEKQEKTIAWMAAASGQSIDQYKATIRAHIIDKNGGKTPETLLAEAAKNGVNTKKQGWVQAVLAALPIVIDIIKKIASLFKKKDPPTVDAMDGSDMSEYAAEYQNSLPPAQEMPTNTTPTNNGGRVITNPSPIPYNNGGGTPMNNQTGAGANNNTMLIGLAALAAIVLLKK